jgi:hypothetical protein
MEIAAPVIVSVVPDCRFYRSVADAAAVGFPSGARVFDPGGQRLEVIDGALPVSKTEPDGADELAEVLARIHRRAARVDHELVARRSGAGFT